MHYELQNSLYNDTELNSINARINDFKATNTTNKHF